MELKLTKALLPRYSATNILANDLYVIRFLVIICERLFLYACKVEGRPILD